MAHIVRSLPPTWKAGKEFLALSFHLVQLQLLGIFEPVHGIVSLLLFLLSI